MYTGGLHNVIWPRAFIIAKFNNCIHLTTIIFSFFSLLALKMVQKFARPAAMTSMFDRRKLNNGIKNNERAPKIYNNG
jgi:hypothetical protein